MPLLSNSQLFDRRFDAPGKGAKKAMKKKKSVYFTGEEALGKKCVNILLHLLSVCQLLLLCFQFGFGCKRQSINKYRIKIRVKKNTGFPVTSKNIFFSYLRCNLAGSHMSPLLKINSHLQGQHRTDGLLSVGFSAVAQLTNERCRWRDKCLIVPSYLRWRRMTLCVCERGVREW